MTAEPLCCSPSASEAKPEPLCCSPVASEAKPESLCSSPIASEAKPEQLHSPPRRLGGEARATAFLPHRLGGEARATPLPSPSPRRRCPSHFVPRRHQNGRAVEVAEGGGEAGERRTAHKCPERLRRLGNEVADRLDAMTAEGANRARQQRPAGRVGERREGAQMSRRRDGEAQALPGGGRPRAFAAPGAALSLRVRRQGLPSLGCNPDRRQRGSRLYERHRADAEGTQHRRRNGGKFADRPPTEAPCNPERRRRERDVIERCGEDPHCEAF